MAADLRTLAGAGLCMVLLASGTVVAAQDPVLPTVLRLHPVGSSGVSGLAILTETGAGTSVQVQVAAAPAGASAAIHPGSCDPLDPTPTALLGDVSSTSLVTTTLPMALDALADGAHAIAIHPGLDLATVLACGDIPATRAASPGASQGPTASVDASRFASPTWGWAITWPDEWDPVDLGLDPALESISLSNGTSTVTILAFDQDAGDAMGCLRDWEGNLLGALRDGDIVELAPVKNADGSSLWDGDTQRARGGYTYRFATGPEDPPQAEVVECRQLSDTAVLQTQHLVPAESFADEAPRLEALLAGLELGAPVATQGPQSSEAPVEPTIPPVTAPPVTAPPVTPEPVVTPPPTPEPTPGPDCTGLATWTTATLARFDRLKAIGDEIARSANAGMDTYSRALAAGAVEIAALRAEQAREATPASLANAQKDLDDLFRTLGETYDILSQAYATVDTVLAQQGFAKGAEAEAILKQVRTEVREIVDPCGIRIPAA